MLSDSTVALIGLFLAIGGQYAGLYQINSKIDDLKMEFAACPYHRKGAKPGVGDES